MRNHGSLIDRAGTATDLDLDLDATCAACELDLEHCHAVLLEHHDGTVTCVDGCGLPRLAHLDVLECAEHGPPGCCEGEEVVAAEPSWATAA
jgi:hypothetical protein